MALSTVNTPLQPLQECLTVPLPRGAIPRAFALLRRAAADLGIRPVATSTGISIYGATHDNAP
eukprot:12427309-Prorocentrum_lima.AAC.1